MKTVGQHRYALVLLLLLVVVLFTVLTSDSAVSRLIALGLQAVALLLVVVTSNHDLTIRRSVSLGVIVAVVVVCTIAAIGSDPPWLVNGLGSVLIVVTIVELVRGMLRLLRERGVTVQAIAGGIALYLLFGLFFAGVIGVLAAVGTQPYYAQGYDGGTSDHVYFSFTSMTTTGFGDLSPATRPGRSLAVLEMLVGQIYLVTVISLLVSRARRSGER
jgi:hypothetical protein